MLLSQMALPDETELELVDDSTELLPEVRSFTVI
jgi:hypothetical protein